MRALTMGVVGVVMLGLLALPAQAELITINIEGVVDTVEDSGNYLEDQIHVGDIISGWYTYDTDTPDSSPDDPVQGNYWHYSPPAGITLSIGGLLFQSDQFTPEFHLAVRNDIVPAGGDIYALVSYQNLALGEIPVDYISWQLIDYTGTALSDDCIPTTSPELLDWEFNHLRVESDRRFIVDAHITYAVPEPCTLLLLGTGLFAIVRRIH